LLVSAEVKQTGSLARSPIGKIHYGKIHYGKIHYGKIHYQRPEDSDQKELLFG